MTPDAVDRLLHLMLRDLLEKSKATQVQANVKDKKN